MNKHAIDSAAGKSGPVPETQMQFLEHMADFRTQNPNATRPELSQEAAKWLFFSAGIRPTANLILQGTGRGSFTDIQKDLGAFWEKVRTAANTQLNVPGLPENLQDLAGELLSQIWRRAGALANEELSVFRSGAEERVHAAQQAEAAALEQLEASRVELQAIRQALQAEQQRREQAEQVVSARDAEIQTLNAVARQTQVNLEREKTDRQRAEESFARQITALKEAARHSEEMHSGELRFAKLQIEEARAHHRKAEEVIERNRSDRDLQDAIHAKNLQDLRQQVATANMAAATMEGRFQSLQEERDRLLGEVADLRKALANPGETALERDRQKIADALKKEAVHMPAIFEVQDTMEAALAVKFSGQTREFTVSLIADDPCPPAGAEGEKQEPEKITVTQQFRSLGELETYCLEHLEQYCEVSRARSWPEKPFWETGEEGAENL